MDQMSEQEADIGGEELFAGAEEEVSPTDSSSSDDFPAPPESADAADEEDDFSDMFEEENNREEPKSPVASTRPVPLVPPSSPPPPPLPFRPSPFMAQGMQLGVKLYEQRRKESEYLRFVEEFPELQNYEKDIPESVWAKVRAGENLTAAYRGYRLEQVQLELEGLKKQGENQKRAFGSAIGDAATEEGDAFLEGFLG